MANDAIKQMLKAECRRLIAARDSHIKHGNKELANSYAIRLKQTQTIYKLYREARK